MIKEGVDAIDYQIPVTQLREVRFRGVRVGVAPCMPSPNILTFMVSEISAFIRTDGHGKIHSPSDPDEEYVYYMGSEALPSIFSYFYFPKNLVYPFTLRVTGINIGKTHSKHQS